MKGWKTWVAAGIVVIIGAVQGVEAAGLIPAGIGNAVSGVLAALAGAFGIVGIGHKLEKLKE